jgi:hypothetical protein
MEDYITTKEACQLLNSTRQNLFYLKKHKILIDFKVIHSTCFLYSRAEILTLIQKGYGNN